MLREHLFITTEYFDNCHKFQIFGVGKKSINQFGLVNKGDKIFFLNKNQLIGPYEVISNIFYNEDIIWKENKGVDAYPYRVRLKSDIVYAIDNNTFFRIIEEEGIRVVREDIIRKSVFTFLPKDTGLIEFILKEKGEKVEKPIKAKEFKKDIITIRLARNFGFSEAFLEFFILENFADFFKGYHNLILYNQFRINIVGSKIDIIGVSPKNVLIIELKKGIIKDEDIKQFQNYIFWAKNNKKLIERFFKISLGDGPIRGLIIGSGIIKNISTSDDFSIKKYSLEDNQLVLYD